MHTQLYMPINNHEQRTYSYIPNIPYIPIHTRCTEWVRNYLSNRKQYVEINTDKNSVCDCPESRIIQGSVGSLLLYTIYTSDMPEIVNFMVESTEETLMCRNSSVEKMDLKQMRRN